MPTKIGSAATSGSTSGWTNVASASVSHTVPAGSNRCLVVGICAVLTTSSAAASRTVTWNGASLTLVGTQIVAAGNNNCVELWYLPESGLSTATANVVVTAVSQNQALWIGAQTWSGVDQTTPLSGFAGEANAVAPSLTITTQPGDEVVDMVGGYSNGTMTWTAGNTLTWVLNATATASIATGQQSATASGTSTAISWTGSDYTGPPIYCAASLKAASANAISGSAADTQAGNTTAATGSNLVSGSAADAQAPNSTSAAGAVGISGTAADTQQPNTTSAAGAVAVSGLAADLSAPDISNGAANVGGGAITGSAAITQQPDVSDGEADKTKGAGDYPKKRRYATKIGRQLVVIPDPSVLDLLHEEEPEPIKVPIQAIKAKAKVYNLDKEMAALLKAQDYSEALKVYEDLQDEEDIEMLLLAL